MWRFDISDSTIQWSMFSALGRQGSCLLVLLEREGACGGNKSGVDGRAGVWGWWGANDARYKLDPTTGGRFFVGCIDDVP